MKNFKKWWKLEITMTDEELKKRMIEMKRETIYMLILLGIMVLEIFIFLKIGEII